MARLLGNRWVVVVIGVLVLIAGGYFYFNAIVPTYTQLDGTIAEYKEFTRNGQYNRNELMLTGDNRIFTLNKNDFHPALPEEVTLNAKVTVWYLSPGDKNTVYAITLFDNNGENPQKHTTDCYDDPQSFQRNNQLFGVAVAGIGALVLLIGLLWPLFPWGRNRNRRRHSRTAISLARQAARVPAFNANHLVRANAKSAAISLYSSGLRDFASARARFSATRKRTILVIRSSGSGWSRGNCTAPFETV
jgi:hypothetical protein